MTVPSENYRSGPYNGNGSTTNFGFNFRVLNASHIRVIRTVSGVETTLALGPDYSVNGVGADQGGEIVMSVAPVSGSTITIVRDVPFVQETDLVNQGPYYAETIEGALDLGVMRDQQLAERMSRAIMVPVSSEDYDPDELVNEVLAVKSNLAASNAALSATEEARDEAVAAAAGVSLPLVTSGSAGKMLRVLPDESGYELVRINDASANTVNLLSVLSDAEIDDVLTGTNAIDITAKVQSLIASAPDGSIVDMTMLTGEVTFSSDIFNGLHTKPVTIKTGRVTIAMDFNGKNFKIPSFCTWEANGTRIKPTTTIDSIMGENTPGAALVETYFGGSGRTGGGSGTTYTVSDATGIHVGTRIAIFGTQTDFYFQFTLGSSIDENDTTIPVVGDGTSVADSITPGIITLRLSGTEFVRGLFTAGALDTTYPGGGRGQFGGTPTSHSNGAPVLLMQSKVHTVTAVNGNVLTLDTSIGVGHSPGTSQFRFGSVGSRLIGKIEIDGEYDRAEEPTNVWSCLGSTLSNDFKAAGGITLRRAPTGGYFMIGTKDVRLDIDLIERCGRPATGLGGDGWLFGKNHGSNVHVHTARDGAAACLIDNKSSGINLFGLEQPNEDFFVSYDYVHSHQVGIDVTGSHHGYARIGYSDCSDSHAGVFNGLPQQWAAIDPTGVTIEIAAMKAHKAPTGNSLAGNTVILAGKTGRVIDADLVLESGQSAPADSDTVVTFSATGAKVGDKVKIDMPSVAPLPAGVLLQHAYVLSENNVRLVFKNVTGIGQTIPAQTFKARIEGPW